MDCCKSNDYHTFVSSSFIRGKGVPTVYDNSFPDTLTNNPPPTQIFVRTEIINGKPYFNINGKTQPRLLLTKGKKYQFNIVTKGHKFYFSSKPMGNPDIFGIPPVDYDLRTYTTPDHDYYYTSTNGMAGKVKVIT